MKPIPESGFTLVEFIISLTLGLYVMMFASNLYLNLYKNLLFMQGVADIQSNAPIGLATLRHDVRMAGFIGCPHINDVKLSGANAFTADQILIGWRPGQAMPIAGPKLSSAPDSDLLMVQYVDSRTIPIIQAKDHAIRFVNKPTISPNTACLISDCRHAETVQLDNVHLRYHYQQDAHFSTLHRVVYFVAKTHRHNQNRLPIYALYRRDLNAPDHQPTELIENVEKMEVRYHIASQHGTLQTVRAGSVMDWTQVNSITVTLHMSSLENASFNMGRHHTRRHTSTKQRLTDRRLKRKWQQTIALRSRITDYDKSRLNLNDNLH